MKKFRFRLERILQLKSHAEKEKQKNLMGVPAVGEHTRGQAAQAQHQQVGEDQHPGLS